MTRQATRGEKRLLALVFGALLVLAGIGALSYGVHTVVRASHMEDWPTVRGTVVHSDIRVQRPKSGGGTSTVIADIRYEYVVEGRTYRGDSVSPGQFGTSNTDHAREEIARYPVGKSVPVHYNPQDPSEAVLEPGWGWIYSIAFALGAVAAVAGGFLLRTGLRMSSA